MEVDRLPRLKWRISKRGEIELGEVVEQQKYPRVE